MLVGDVPVRVFDHSAGSSSQYHHCNHQIVVLPMYWTLELAYHLEDAPWPATRDELVDYAIRSGAPVEVIENLQQMEDDGEIYESIEDIWPDYPRKDDFLFNEDEY